MSEAYILTEEKIEWNVWDSKEHEVSQMILLPSNPSAFPYGIKELCESRVSILCGTPSLPCSG